MEKSIYLDESEYSAKYKHLDKDSDLNEFELLLYGAAGCDEPRLFYDNRTYFNWRMRRMLRARGVEEV